MAILYGRRLIVEVAGLTIEGLRITVDVAKQMDPTQDKGKVSIYNLSDANEQRIYERGGPIKIQAGYPETVSILFEGFVQRVVRAREDLARITHISLGDKVRGKETLGGVFLFSYAGQVSSRQIATDIIGAMGLEAGPLDAIPAGATFENFYYPGVASLALEALLRPVNCHWFEEDGVIRINSASVTQADGRTVAVNVDTGLIDSPITTDEGAEVRVLLNPLIKLGSVLEIESESVKGSWKVVGMRHYGDNWEGQFETFCDLRALG